MGLFDKVMGKWLKHLDEEAEQIVNKRLRFLESQVAKISIVPKKVVLTFNPPTLIATMEHQARTYYGYGEYESKYMRTQMSMLMVKPNQQICVDHEEIWGLYGLSRRGKFNEENTLNIMKNGQYLNYPGTLNPNTLPTRGYYFIYPPILLRQHDLLEARVSGDINGGKLVFHRYVTRIW